MVEVNNRRPGVSLYALDVTPEEALDTLRVAGLEAELVGPGSSSVRLLDGSSPAAALAALPVAVVQDPAATLVAGPRGGAGIIRVTTARDFRNIAQCPADLRR